MSCAAMDRLSHVSTKAATKVPRQHLGEENEEARAHQGSQRLELAAGEPAERTDQRLLQVTRPGRAGYPN